MAYSGRFNVTLSTFLFLFIHIKPQARGQYLAVSLMAKYKLVFNTCECSNLTCASNKQALEAAKTHLDVMRSLNPRIRYVMVAKVIGCGRYSIVGRYEF